MCVASFRYTELPVGGITRARPESVFLYLYLKCASALYSDASCILLSGYDIQTGSGWRAGDDGSRQRQDRLAKVVIKLFGLNK